MIRTVVNLSKHFKVPVNLPQFSSFDIDAFRTFDIIEINPNNYKKFTFSGGEEHIKFDDEEVIMNIKKSHEIIIGSSLENSSDIMTMFLAKNALENLNSECKIHLFSPYFPYARQDRAMVKGEPLSVKVMANLINQQHFSSVSIFDPHSDVSSALINNVNILSMEDFIKESWNRIIKKFGNKSLVVVSPDAGAEKKIFKVAKMLDLDNDQIILGSKNRDVRNGRILGSDFKGNVQNKICVIQDDIIDGGATFTELAKLLKNNGADKVLLIVSHGIFSKGIEPLKANLDGIYTTDSIKNFPDYHPFVETIRFENMKF